MVRLNGSAAQIDYRLGGHHGCSDHGFDYRTDARERPLRWMGSALPALGIAPGSELAPKDFVKARSLMAGVHPVTGEQLVKPKLGVFEDSKVPLAPLVAAVRQRAQEQGVTPTALLGNERLAREFASAERAVERLGDGAKRRADDAGRIADAVGLDVEVVWPAGVFEKAVAGLWEVRGVLDDQGLEGFEVVPRRQVVGNAGYDIAFTLPKSNSLLLAFAEDGTADRIEDTYAQCVTQTFGWLEGRTSFQMRGKHGQGKTARRVVGSGFAGWAMVHRSARPVAGEAIGDPHWHVHVTIANLTQAEDGKWSTVAAGGRELMNHAPTVDHVLKALVRGELSRQYGVEWARNDRTGAWEVATIPDETLVAFSRRGANIRGMLTELGYDNTTASSTAKRIAEAHARGGKEDSSAASDATLREHWAHRAHDLGLDVAGMVHAALHGPGQQGEGRPNHDRVEEIRQRLLDPETGLTAHKRRAGWLEAVAVVADSLPTGAESIEEIETLTNAVLADDRFVAIEGRPNDRPMLTTQDVIDAEKVIFTRAEETHGFVTVEVEVAQAAVELTEVTQGYELSEEQARAVFQLTGSGRAIETLLGPPGTGKTTLLRAANTAWEAGGHRVLGVATAGVAAQNLQLESGIESVTIAKVLFEANNGTNLLDGVQVCVVDEANLTDDRARAHLYLLAAETGTKVVEVGDHLQLRGVGCGSSFGVLHTKLGGPELTENRRQKYVDERNALARWRDGDFLGALQSWHTRGRLIEVDTIDEKVADMAATWRAETTGAPDAWTALEGVVMIAGTNESVDRLNATVQGMREQQGEVSNVTEWHLAAGRVERFGVGDQVMLRRNDRQGRLTGGQAVVNGQRALVTDTHPDHGVTVQWKAEGPDGPTWRTAVLDQEYISVGGLQLGYAMTAHKAEGLTVSADWQLPDGQHQHGTTIIDVDGMDNAGLYVAASRHKGRMLAFGATEVTEVPTHEDQTPATLLERVNQLAARTRTDPNDTPVTDPGETVVVDQGDISASDALLARAKALRTRAQEHSEQGQAPQISPTQDTSAPLPPHRDRGIDR
ncbi:MobF family relaxase [Enemella sp. A6]|uniref:MobF family relaxase n=1 Tax=Enemella sp. A6 TaxID=3440152 RepID=UPI003EBF63B9